MANQITVRELVDRLEDGPVVLVRGIPWNVAGVKQQADHTDGSMRVHLKLTRQDPDGTARRLMYEVELGDSIQLADAPSD